MHGVLEMLGGFIPISGPIISNYLFCGNNCEVFLSSEEMFLFLSYQYFFCSNWWPHDHLRTGTFKRSCNLWPSVQYICVHSYSAQARGTMRATKDTIKVKTCTGW